MKMKNKTYDIIKILIIIVLPAVITFIGIVLEALNVSCSGTIMTILIGFEAMCGGIIEKISAAYKKAQLVDSEK